MDLHHRQVTNDRLLVRLVNVPVHNHLVENVMDLLQIEHDLHVKECGMWKVNRICLARSMVQRKRELLTNLEKYNSNVSTNTSMNERRESAF